MKNSICKRFTIAVVGGTTLCIHGVAPAAGESEKQGEISNGRL